MEFSRFVAYWQAKNNFDNHEKKLKSIQSVLRTTKNFSPTKQRNKSVNNYYTNRSFEIQLQNKALLTKLIQQKSRKECKSIQRVGRPFNKNKKFEYFKQYQKQNQNRDLLKKIKSVKGSYRMQHYIQDYKQKEKYMNLICKFPVRGLKPTKTLLKLTATPKRKSESQLCNPLERKYPKSQEKRERKSRIKTTKNQKNQKNQMESIIYRNKPSKKILRIFNVQKLEIDQKDVVVKGVQYEEFLLLQLLIQGNIKELRITNQQFTQIFKNNYQKLCESIQYDQYSEQFYL